MFQEMQIAAQLIIAHNPRILEIQKWATQQADNVPAYKGSFIRSLYWHNVLKFARDISSKRAYVSEGAHSDIMRMNDISRSPVASNALKLACDLDRELALKLALRNNPDSSLDLDNDFRLRNALERIFHFGLDHAHNNAYNQYLNPYRHNIIRKFDDKGFDRSLDNVFKNKYLFQTCDDLDVFKFDMNTIKLVRLSEIFYLLPRENRSKTRVAKLQKFLSAWLDIPGNPLRQDDVPILPTHEASNSKWNTFFTIIMKTAENLLGVNLSKPLDWDDYQVIEIYLEANQFILECLQVARVDNCSEIEDMILIAPSGNNVLVENNTVEADTKMPG